MVLEEITLSEIKSEKIKCRMILYLYVPSKKQNKVNKTKRCIKTDINWWLPRGRWQRDGQNR